MREFFRRLRFLMRPSGAWQMGYDQGYHVGLDEGTDFGKRIAYNQVLAKELPHILSRYAQLQVKVINKPKMEIQKALHRFQEQEIERFKMEMQER
jgi:hypothetical protein